MLIVTPIVGFFNCSMFCCSLFYVHSSFAIILMGKRGLVALLCLSSWCLVIVVWLFLMMPRVCLQFVVVVIPDHTHLLFLKYPFLRNHCLHEKVHLSNIFKIRMVSVKLKSDTIVDQNLCFGLVGK